MYKFNITYNIVNRKYLLMLQFFNLCNLNIFFIIKNIHKYNLYIR